MHIYTYIGITASPVVEGENIMVAETPISAQENFAKLLKETMDQQNSVTVEDDEVILLYL
jgi:carbonic anhydrase